MATPKMNIGGYTAPNKQQAQNSQPVTVLTDEECWELANRTRFARLGTLDEGKIFITPINIVVSDQKIYFRTAAGSKLTRLQLQEQVTVEFDRAEGGSAYSVNIHGRARLLTDTADIEQAESLGINPWLNTEKIEFVEITPQEITGRYFRLGE